MLSAFRIKQLLFPAARWGGAAGTIGFFLLYEDLPQLILQTQYGVFPGFQDVLVSFGFITQAKANWMNSFFPQASILNRPVKDPPSTEEAEE